MIFTNVSNQLFTGVFGLLKDLKINNQFLSFMITKISTNTLGIYFIHWILGYVLIDLIYGIITHEQLWGNIIKTIIIISASLAISFVIKKTPYMKKLLEF